MDSLVMSLLFLDFSEWNILEYTLCFFQLEVHPSIDWTLHRMHRTHQFTVKDTLPSAIPFSRFKEHKRYSEHIFATLLNFSIFTFLVCWECQILQVSCFIQCIKWYFLIITCQLVFDIPIAVILMQDIFSSLMVINCFELNLCDPATVVLNLKSFSRIVLNDRILWKTCIKCDLKSSISDVQSFFRCFLQSLLDLVLFRDLIPNILILLLFKSKSFRLARVTLVSMSTISDGSPVWILLISIPWLHFAAQKLCRLVLITSCRYSCSSSLLSPLYQIRFLIAFAS